MSVRVRECDDHHHHHHHHHHQSVSHSFTHSLTHSPWASSVSGLRGSLKREPPPYGARGSCY
eukprot:1053855-Pyramimonas_sp.AAC.1